MTDSGKHLDFSSDYDFISGSVRAQAAGRRTLCLLCHVYCPRCGRAIELCIGAGGSNSRFFTAY